MAIASPISGLILQYGNGMLGLAGWRWLFLLEGLPSTVLGIITLFYLCDRPALAKWLTDTESAAIEARLQREQGPQAPPRKVWRDVFSSKVILLALMYFGLVFGLNTALTWTPLIVRDVVKARNLSFIGVLTSIPAICAVIFMVIWSAHSDRKLERIRHFAIPATLAAAGWLCVSFLTRPEARMLGVIVAVVGALGAQPIFWSIPPRVIPPKARPVGIAFISSCGMVAGATSGMVLGFFREVTHTWVASLMFVTAMLLMAAVLVFWMPPEQVGATEPKQARQTSA
jgi:ACS family 4-hydroxyphenylacetate permease-like MFS transporter